LRCDGLNDLQASLHSPTWVLACCNFLQSTFNISPASQDGLVSVVELAVSIASASPQCRLGAAQLAQVIELALLDSILETAPASISFSAVADLC
jgi:hypothetical protein